MKSVTLTYELRFRETVLKYDKTAMERNGEILNKLFVGLDRFEIDLSNRKNCENKEFGITVKCTKSSGFKSHTYKGLLTLSDEKAFPLTVEVESYSFSESLGNLVTIEYQLVDGEIKRITGFF